MRLIAAVAALFLTLAHPAGAPALVRVLFIGNSLTVANDLPVLVKAMATAARQPFEYRVVAYPDYSLEDHWGRGEAQRAIAAGGWTFVVLQQGPSALPESRVLLRDYARRFATEATKVGARTALYMVWPSSMRPTDFPGVHASYQLAAEDVSGLFLPAGDAWREAWQREPDMALYGPDGFHPTLLGSDLVAAVLFEGLFGRSPVGVPIPGLSVERARFVEECASAAFAKASR